MRDVVSSINSPLAPEDKGVKSLHDVDGLRVSTNTDIEDSKITSVADIVLNYDPEAMIWQDSPSPSLMLPSILKWMAIIAIWALALFFLRPAPTVDTSTSPTSSVKEAVEAQPSKVKKGKNSQKVEESPPSPKVDPIKQFIQDNNVYTWTLYIGILVIIYQFYSHVKWYLQLKNINYKISSQRLSIESGIFSKAVEAYELHQLRSGQVYKPWNLRLFRRENLYISGLWLSGIRNAEAVRDLIRNAGQIEASRIEKARFR